MARFTEVPAAPRASAFSSLRHQQFRWLYASNIAFFFAMNGQFVVRSYLAYALTGSELALGMINMVVAVFFMGCTFPFIMPARQAIVVSIVGRQGLGNAMALQMGGMNAARVVGPVLAGFIIALAGVRWVYVVAVTMYAVALFS